MATKKGGLGRGLDSLFADTGSAAADGGADVGTLALSDIQPDKDQPRKTFGPQALAELSKSIEEHGVVQPIVVRPNPAGGYRIVAGERRWRAARQAGLREIPALVREISDTEALELALVENLQREDLDPVEEALSGDRVINMLFVLEDKRKPLSTYVLMYYPTTRRAAVFDIPGELGLIIRQINRVDRVDTVYDPKNVSGFEKEIEGILGIDINFYLVLDTDSLGKVVDLIEGVDLFIPSRVSIRNEDGVILFPSGVTRLDGDKAKTYITYEIPEEEQEMAIFRRQRFFLGFLKRLGEMNESLKNPAVARLYQSLLGTDMNQRTRIRLFDEFVSIDTDRTGVQSIGGIVREVSGQSLLLPYYDGSLVKEIVRQTLGGLTRQTEGSLSERVFTVEVLNGTAANGLAGRTAELLRGFGYDVISIGNADRNDYERTEIIDRSGYSDMVQTFGDIIRCENIRSEASLQENPEEELTLQNFEYRSDFTLIIGKDFNGRHVTGN
jgi:anionic cell wall polymer biosynthesis LytR-Cps2A-Psr (LCP) family protein